VRFERKRDNLYRIVEHAVRKRPDARFILVEIERCGVVEGLAHTPPD